MYPFKLLVLSENNASLPFSFHNDEIHVEYMDIYNINLSEILIFNPDLIVLNTKQMDTMPLYISNILTNHYLTRIPLIFIFHNFSKKSYMNALKYSAVEVFFHPVEENYFISKIKAIAQAVINCKNNEDSFLPEKVSHFIRKVIDVIKQHLDNPYFSVEDLADHMALSRVQLYRNIKKDTNKSVSEFIRCVRLNAAIQMMRDEKDRISEIAYKVGFENPSYFTSCFKKHFGVTPSQYLN